MKPLPTVKPLRRQFVFETAEGRVYRVKTGETGGHGNRHFNRRRTPTCACGHPWKPVCPNATCGGNIEPRRVMRIEKYGRKSREGRPGR